MYIKNWGPMYILNVNTKMISKAFAEKLKEAFPSVISQNQAAYVKIFV